MDNDKYTDSQMQYFLNEINRAIPATLDPNVDSETISAALGSDRPYNTGSTTYTANQFISVPNKTTQILKEDSICRKLSSPANMHTPEDLKGCGWWYIPNPAIQSVGAYGTYHAPMDPTLDTQYGPGKWIWDTKEAAESENIKQTSKYKTCSDIALAGDQNIGWCPSTNKAVVVDGKGNPAYPNNPKGDCPGGGVITSSSDCDPSWKCKGLGYPSDDGQLRLYSEEDCNNLGGRWNGNGECVNPKGGSWSAVCKGLNNGAQGYSSSIVGGSGSAPVDVCAPNNGMLMPQCLQKIANLKCNPSGTLSQALKSGYAGTSEKFREMSDVLHERGFTIAPGIVNDGNISVQDAMRSVDDIKYRMANDSNPRTSAAAKNLCFGTSFNPCDMTNNTRKPFTAMCITRVARAAGWSYEGAAMPSNSGMGEWDKLATWGDVLNVINSWKNLADNPGPNQLEYIKKVYGINASYPDHCVTQDLGCWRDTWDRALNSGGQRGHNKDSCEALAKKRNHRYFSVQDGNECYTGTFGYNKHGRVTGPGPGCPPGGGPWLAHTWRIPGLSLQNPNLVLNTSPVAPPWDQETVKREIIPTTITNKSTILVGADPRISITAKEWKFYRSDATYYLGDIVAFEGKMYINLSWDKDNRGPAYRGTHQQPPNVDTYAWMPIVLYFGDGSRMG